MAFLKHRTRREELMDAPDVDPRALRKALSFIRRVNSFFGYTRATIAHLERFSARWAKGQTIHLLDIATGSADIPRAILAWADRRGFDVRIVGVDLHALTTQTAREQGADDRLTLVQADVFDLPFEPASFDYVLTAMFLHHLDDADVVRVLATMDRLARKGVIVADLLRHYRAYAWISFFTALSHPMIRHDAKVSVGQAFTRGEIEGLAGQGGISYAVYHRHFGHRFVLAGEKSGR